MAVLAVSVSSPAASEPVEGRSGSPAPPRVSTPDGQNLGGEVPVLCPRATVGPWFTPVSGTSKESKTLASSVSTSPRSGRKWGLPLPGLLIPVGLAPGSLFPPGMPTLFC